MDKEQYLFNLSLSKLEPIFKKWVKEANQESELQKTNNENNDYNKPLTYYNQKEVAEIFGVSENTIKNYRNNGVLNYLRIGRNIRFTDEQIQDALIRIDHTKALTYSKNTKS